MTHPTRRFTALISRVSWLIGINVIQTADWDSTTPFKPVEMGFVFLTSSFGLYLASKAQIDARHGGGSNLLLFWLGLAIMFAGPAFRISATSIKRAEAISIISFLGFSSFFLKLTYDPSSFTMFDEFLHWVTVQDILATGRLYSDNSLLPVSALYPGLELITSSIVETTGLSIQKAGLLLVGFIKIDLVITIFFLYEKITGSTRIGSIGTILFMANPSFTFFHSQFSYETLAFLILCGALLSMSLQIADDRDSGHLWAITVVSAGALSITHHLSSYIGGALVLVIVLLEFILKRRSYQVYITACCGLLFCMFPVFWARLIDAPTGGYLGPIFQNGIYELEAILTGHRQAKGFFAVDPAPVTPIPLRLLVITSTLMVCIGLATGFLRTLGLGSVNKEMQAVEDGTIIWKKIGILDAFWSRYKPKNSLLGALVFFTIMFPVSICLRMTSSGWELGNRLGPFVFTGVAVVLAVSWTTFWSKYLTRNLQFYTGIALTVMFLGGVVAGWGVEAVRGTYKVSADGQSVENMGKTTAQWAADFLGPGHRFGTDRVNSILLATYGKQDIVSSMVEKSSVSPLFMHLKFTDSDISVAKELRIDFLLADRRLTLMPPRYGGYYSSSKTDEAGDKFGLENITKFDQVAKISRIYDNGYISIYDLRDLLK